MMRRGDIGTDLTKGGHGDDLLLALLLLLGHKVKQLQILLVVRLGENLELGLDRGSRLLICKTPEWANQH